MLIKILIVLVLVAIVASLGSGLFHLVREDGQSKRLVNSLSVTLFVLLFVAWQMGLIAPHHLR
jgi:ABC-type sulfate transport system permease component